MLAFATPTASMKSFAAVAVALLAAALPTAMAQTHTECNPLTTKGCPNMQALGDSASFYFNRTDPPFSNKVWKKQNQGDIAWSEKGATFIIRESGDAPMVQSKFYMLFGRFEMILRVSRGTGIVSTGILQSEALDEVDWEFLGQSNEAMTNYFGKGNNQTYDRGQEFPMDPPPQEGFHNYTVDWTVDRIQWWLDGKMVRELLPADALNGTNYPQTPMNIRIGIWAAGDVKKNQPGVVEWAGGKTDFSKGPFTMTVQEVYAKDYTTAKEYSWEDMDASGSWEKVKVISEGKSAVLKEIQHPSGIAENWEALSSGVKTGIVGGSLGAFVLGLLVIAFCCVKQRRVGRIEHQLLLDEEQKEAAELQEYKKKMQGGRFGLGSQQRM